MKRLALLSLFALGLCTTPFLARAQDSPRMFSASLALNEKGQATPVIAANLRSFTNVWDKPGFNLDLKGLTVIQSNLKLGFALTYTVRKTVPFSAEFRPKLELAVGPWVNYGTGSGKLSGGLFLGFGGSF